MVYVNYTQVGKEVLIAGIGGTVGIAAHFMFLQPQFAGQQIIPGVQMTTIVDVLVGFIVGIATTMYAKSGLAKIAGYGVAGVMVAIGLAQQFGLMGTATTARARYTPTAARFTQGGTTAILRAGYLAPSGVVVNKHGSVPEIAPGTFG